KTLASVDLDGTIIIWDLEEQRERRRFGHPSEPVVSYCLAFSPDARLIATSHGVYETASGRQLANFLYQHWVNASAIYGLAFSADGTRLAIANAHGLQTVCDTTTWQLVEQVDLSPRQFISVSFAPDGKQ